jgi:hypothetical protein
VPPAGKYGTFIVKHGEKGGFTKFSDSFKISIHPKVYILEPEFLNS